MKYLWIIIPLLTVGCAQHDRKNYQMADVTKVEPVFKTLEIRKPKKVCEERQVVERQSDSAAPTVVGAVVGGILGRAVGGRSAGDKNVGMVAGAVIGGAIGNEAGKQNGEQIVKHETVCFESGYDVEYQSVIDGYHVTYILNGKEYNTVLDHEPGAKMPVYVEPAKNR